MQTYRIGRESAQSLTEISRRLIERVKETSPEEVLDDLSALAHIDDCRLRTINVIGGAESVFADGTISLSEIVSATKVDREKGSMVVSTLRTTLPNNKLEPDERLARELAALEGVVAAAWYADDLSDNQLAEALSIKATEMSDAYRSWGTEDRRGDDRVEVVLELPDREDAYRNVWGTNI